jgi:tRNA-specific 2-thiouridylase
LFRKGLFIEKSEVHWIRNDMTLGNGEQMEVMARIRYRQPLQAATLHQFENGMYVSLKNINAITEGQFAAWYIEDELVGSGVIS